MADPAVTDVACGDDSHRVALVDRDVVLLDHDEAAEHVLAALGGVPARCLWLATIWRDPPWTDAVSCLVLDDDGAAANSSGKATAAAGLEGQLQQIGGTRSASPVVDRLTISAALLALPLPFRFACGHRALAAQVAAWPMGPTDRELLEHQLEPLLSRRLTAEGRHLPPGGRSVRARVLGPGADRALVPGRRCWEAHIPVDAVRWLLTTQDALSPWFSGTPS